MGSDARNDATTPGHAREHVAEDEALAAAARARFRNGRRDGVEADDELRGALDDGEDVVATGDGAVVYNGVRGGRRVDGPLAVTTTRLIAVGPPATTIASLDDMDDAIVATGQLHVTVTDGSGFTVETPYPRLLRVQLAEARARRADGQAEGPVEPATGDSLR